MLFQIDQHFFLLHLISMRRIVKLYARLLCGKIWNAIGRLNFSLNSDVSAYILLRTFFQTPSYKIIPLFETNSIDNTLEIREYLQK